MATWYRGGKDPRFCTAINAALASQNPRKRAFAWLVIDVVGHGGHGCGRAFARIVGLSPARVSQYLSDHPRGGRDIPQSVLEQLASKLNMPIERLVSPHHPLAIIPATGEPLEPGDEGFEGAYRIFREVFPRLGLQEIEALKRLKPALFPPSA